MKDEIKEKIKAYYFANDIDKILDYITNLQEQLHKASLDIQELTERDLMCPTSCDKLTNLQEENERLKEKAHNQKVANAYEIVQIDKLQTNIKTQIRRRKKEAQLKRQYKSRINKAIEYIKSNLDNTGWLEIGSQDVEVLINLLQGSDE